MKNKTIQLFNNYLVKYGVLEEQTPEQPGSTVAGMNPAGITPIPNTAQEAPTGVPKQLTSNEKYVIKILTNAFIFNPKMFGSQREKYIYNKIDTIKNMVNVPVSKVIKNIKQIISLDRSLRVESKTLNLLNKYMIFIEQSADATEPQSDTSKIAPSADTKLETPPGSNSENDLDLSEVFNSLYKELIMKALKHSPTDEELMIIKPIVNEYADIDPEKIVEAIQSILAQSLEDKEVEDNLSNV
jgi:hypothetical protein